MTLIIKSEYKILNKSDIKRENVAQLIEQVARTCYKSENLITEDSANKLLERLSSSGHSAMLEFYDIVVKFICDRGISHEIVRHRLCSFAQESTRWCNYGKDKFANQVTFILPLVFYNKEYNGKNTEKEFEIWNKIMSESEESYLKLINNGISPQFARDVLPNSLKTEINVKANLREWYHIFEQRCSKEAHPDMRKLMLPLLEEFYNLIPIIYDKLFFQFRQDIMDFKEKYN